DVMSHRGKYVVRNPDGQLEQVMGEVEKDYEGPTLTPEQLKALKPRFMGTVYEGQFKGLLSDMQDYPHYTFTDLLLANGSEGLAKELGGKFTYSRPQQPQYFDSKFDAEDFIASRVQRQLEDERASSGNIVMVPFTNDESSPVFHEGSFIIYD